MSLSGIGSGSLSVYMRGRRTITPYPFHISHCDPSALYHAVRQYELQIGGKMTRTGDFASVDLKSLMDQIEALSTRAEAAETAVKDMRSKNSNGTTHSIPLTLMPASEEDTSGSSASASAVSLKETILRLDSEKAELEKVLQQRDKKIELLEENLRGPVPYETGR